MSQWKIKSTKLDFTLKPKRRPPNIDINKTIPKEKPKPSNDAQNKRS